MLCLIPLSLVYSYLSVIVIVVIIIITSVSALLPLSVVYSYLCLILYLWSAHTCISALLHLCFFDLATPLSLDCHIPASCPFIHICVLSYSSLLSNMPQSLLCFVSLPLVCSYLHLCSVLHLYLFSIIPSICGLYSYPHLWTGHTIISDLFVTLCLVCSYLYLCSFLVTQSFVVKVFLYKHELNWSYCYLRSVHNSVSGLFISLSLLFLSNSVICC